MNASPSRCMLLLAGLCGFTISFAQQPGAASAQTFVTIGFHDVVDVKSQLDDDAVTADNLVGFFEWLRGNGWTAISLDDVARARRGERPLPAKAVLLTFDDGYRSVYTRVYPLALAYDFPIVAALVGDWMEPPMGSMVKYGNRQVPREHFITWEEAREMQRSGLVEFALHTRSLHGEVIGNPQGNTMAAAVTRSYSARGYQTDAEFIAAVRADLLGGRTTMQRELGRAPRTLVWPYGRYNAAGTEAARDAGFEFALVLDQGPSTLLEPLRIARFLPTFDSPLPDLVRNLQPKARELRVDRLTCLDPAALWTGDESTSNERLGRVIERARSLGVTGIIVDAVRRNGQGRIESAWFPTRELPLAGDWLSRIAWQMRTRGNVKVYARLPHRAALASLRSETRVQQLFEDLGGLVPVEGWVLEDAGPMTMPFDAAASEPHPGAPSGVSWAPWRVRARRESLLAKLSQGPDGLAWRAFAALDAARPGLELLWLAPSSTTAPHPLADISLVPAALNASTAERIAPVDPALTRWYASAGPPDPRVLAKASADFQAHGGVSLGWCADDAIADRPAAAIIAPAVSASQFPEQR